MRPEPTSLRYVIFLSGLANITLPHHSQYATLQGGAGGVIFAADTTGDGHITTYPGNTTTVAIQVPVGGGVAPNHTVLYEGGCRARDVKILGT